MRRLGGVRLPVEVLVEFADGRVQRETWDGQYRWARFRYPGGQGASRAVVDPERQDRARRRTPPTTPGWTRRASARRAAAQVGGALDVLAPEPARAAHGARAEAAARALCATGCARPAARAGASCVFLLVVNLGHGRGAGRPARPARCEDDLANTRRRAATCCTASTTRGGATGPTRQRAGRRLRPRHPRRRLRVQEPRPAAAGPAARRACSRAGAGRRRRRGRRRGIGPARSSPSAPPTRPAGLPGRRRARRAARAAGASWTVRGLLHGSGFYFGRFLRLALLALLVDGARLRAQRALRPLGRRPGARGGLRDARPSPGCSAGTPCCCWRCSSSTWSPATPRRSWSSRSGRARSWPCSPRSRFCLRDSLRTVRPLPGRWPSLGVALLAVWAVARRGTGRRPATRPSSSPCSCCRARAGGASSCAWRSWAGRSTLYRRLSGAEAASETPCPPHARRRRGRSARPWPVRHRRHRGHHPRRARASPLGLTVTAFCSVSLTRRWCSSAWTRGRRPTRRSRVGRVRR